MTLVTEYVVRGDKGLASDGKFEVLAIFPMTEPSLQPNSQKTIEVDFDRDFALDDFVNSLADRFYVCSLFNQIEMENVIRPKVVRQIDGSTLMLSFDFHGASIPEKNRCYHIQCTTKQTKGVEFIKPVQIHTNYCIENESDLKHDANHVCNPNAQPKLDKNDKCICSEPYKGDTCQSCESGFKAEKDGLNTKCVFDHDHITETICNGHGRAKNSRATNIEQIECDCDKGFGGIYCDYCSNPEYAYPDCQEGAVSSSIYDPEIAHEFLARKKYNEHGYTTTA